MKILLIITAIVFVLALIVAIIPLMDDFGLRKATKEKSKEKIWEREN